MRYKVKKLVDKYRDIISAWDGVECITLNEAALPDVLDPYFALILDVFYNGSLPSPKERSMQYGTGTQVFESTGSKDRFLDESIPVRFEFKECSALDNLISLAEKKDSIHLLKDAGTYSFYRLYEGDILFQRGKWIENSRRRLDELSDDYWTVIRDAAQLRMEHFLGDLGAALLQNDPFYYLISSSNFIRSACYTLFCINKCFEPSHRQYYSHTCSLDRLPHSFTAQFETFLNQDSGITMERRYETARLVAISIVELQA